MTERCIRTQLVLISPVLHGLNERPERFSCLKEIRRQTGYTLRTFSRRSAAAMPCLATLP